MMDEAKTMRLNEGDVYRLTTACKLYQEQTGSEYIKHHLTNLTFGKDPTDGVWKFAHTAQEAQDMGFYAIHVDSMGWAIGLGIIFITLFSMVARKASTGIPGGLQNAFELVIEFIDSNVKDTFSHKNKLIAPMALTAFVWILLMNLMDLVPVDWVPQLFHLSGVEYMKIVPTTDPNVTMGMSLSVFFLALLFSIKNKGFGGFAGELTLHPFTSKNLLVKLILIPINLFEAFFKHSPIAIPCLLYTSPSPRDS